MSSPENYAQLVAWVVYAAAGVGCCLVWWRITRLIGSPVGRDLLRGLVVVLIYTPWYLGDAPEFYAPAFIILLMDVLLSGTGNGMQGGVALGIASFLMLIVLTARQWRRRRGVAK